jgi:uncharacterized membrane protein
MEQSLEVLAHYTSLAIDLIAILVIAIGSLGAVIGMVRVMVVSSPEGAKRDVWLQYARWLVAGLTFQLAADVVHTAIAPSWDEVGKVAAIAGIRTFLTYFLDRDIDNVREIQRAK